MGQHNEGIENMARRQWIIFAAGTLLALSTTVLAVAAVSESDWKAPGDGLLTYDDINQREWLDLSETQLFKFPGNSIEEQYESVIAETGSGGMFNGFTVATADNVFTLAESAGIDISTSDFSTNQSPADALTDLLGDTRSGLPNKTSAGLLDDQSPLLVVYGPAGREDPSAGVHSWPVANFDNGVWLYREVVPEPTSLAIVLGGLFAAFVYRPRKVIPSCD